MLLKHLDMMKPKRRNSRLGLLLLIGILVGCTAEVPVTPTMAPPPTAVSISVDGEVVKLQEGEMWVLVSGVDEHGLIIEHDLLLLLEPRQNSLWSEWMVHSGTPAAVLEIHYSGPQNLRRFYHIETPSGAIGWISDYYVRPLAYLYEPAAETVPLYAEPEGEMTAELANVSPVKLLDPTDELWWEVEALSGERGWVPVELIKESAARQFLTDTQHEHPGAGVGNE